MTELNIFKRKPLEWELSSSGHSTSKSTQLQHIHHSFQKDSQMITQSLYRLVSCHMVKLNIQPGTEVGSLSPL
jgi:hypothetical protein